MGLMDCPAPGRSRVMRDDRGEEGRLFAPYGSAVPGARDLNGF
jgi:hypothetical protein